MSAVFGILIILAGLLWLNLKDWDLFEIMTVFGSMIAIPIAMPLVWGLFIKGAPRWSAWSTVLVGFLFFVFSKVVEQYGLFGFGETAGREKSVFLYFLSGLGNIVVCSLWFFVTVWAAKMNRSSLKIRIGLSIMMVKGARTATIARELPWEFSVSFTADLFPCSR
jgi:hypothetical protein